MEYVALAIVIGLIGRWLIPMCVSFLADIGDDPATIAGGHDTNE